MKEMSNVETNATTESAGQFYTENRLSNRKNLNFISSYLRGIFWAIGAIVQLRESPGARRVTSRGRDKHWQHPVYIQ